MIKRKQLKKMSQKKWQEALPQKLQNRLKKINQPIVKLIFKKMLQNIKNQMRLRRLPLTELLLASYTNQFHRNKMPMDSS